MARPKAPRALTEAFAHGVDEQRVLDRGKLPGFTLEGQRDPDCWLAWMDPARAPCSGKMERFHFLRRQSVETAMWEALREATVDERCELCIGSGCHPMNVTRPCVGCEGRGTWPSPLLNIDLWEIIHAAAWDHRNADIACEDHHRRYDSHAVSPAKPRIVIPYTSLRPRMILYVRTYGLENLAAERFPGWPRGG